MLQLADFILDVTFAARMDLLAHQATVIVMVVVVFMVMMAAIGRENREGSSNVIGFFDALLVNFVTMAGGRHAAHGLGIMHALGRWWSCMSVVAGGDRRRRWRVVDNLWRWWRSSLDNVLVFVHIRGFCCTWLVEGKLDKVGILTLFVVLADLDDFVNVLFFECTGDDDEVILRRLDIFHTKAWIGGACYLFLVGVPELDNGLFPAQTLGQSGLALLAPVGPGKGDLLETGRRRAASRLCDTLSTAAAAPNPALALLARNFDLAVFFDSLTPSRFSFAFPFSVSHLFELVFVESGRRTSAFADGQRDGNVGWGFPVVGFMVTR